MIQCDTRQKKKKRLKHFPTTDGQLNYSGNVLKKKKISISITGLMKKKKIFF